MLLKDIVTELERFAPCFLAEEWDKVGLQIEAEAQQEIKKVLLCLDVTQKVLKRVQEEKIDLLISHHPLFFSKFSALKQEDPLQKAVLTLVKNNTSYYAMHTNLDAVPYGVGDALVETALQNVDWKKESLDTLAPLSFFKQEKMKAVRPNETLPYGYGRVVQIEKKTAWELLKLIEENLAPAGILRNFSKTEAETRSVKHLAFCNGAFDESWIGLLKERGVELLVTGEIKHHVLMALKEEGIFTLCVGHGTSEIYGMRFLKAYLESLDLPVEILLEEEEHIFE